MKKTRTGGETATASCGVILSLNRRIHMLSQEQAAKFLVVAWVKDWTMHMLMCVLCQRQSFSKVEDKEFEMQFNQCSNEYAWFPRNKFQAMRGARRFVGGFYPKLSEWLFNAKSNEDRLKCFEQIMKLKCPALPVSWREDEDKKLRANTARKYRQSVASYKLSRESFKSNQRSAWNVCKK